jgi:hypothetical protein
VIVDENLPRAMARSLAALFVDDHQIIHIRDRFGAGTTDLEWMRELNGEGRWIVISGDRRIARNKAEQAVFRSSRLIAFIFAPGLQKAPLVKKMERLMVMWARIEQQAGLVEGGAMFEVQMRGELLKSL